jgi:hypothetical protein
LDGVINKLIVPILMAIMGSLIAHCDGQVHDLGRLKVMGWGTTGATVACSGPNADVQTLPD